MPTLEEAVLLATCAHAGQVDKLGQPYILHPLSVMLMMDTDDERIVAVLHDVVEDTSLTLDMLRALGYPEDIISDIDAVTRRDDEIYAEFILRVKRTSVRAVKVKIADIQHNLSPSRRSEDDSSRRRRYEKALKVLQEVEITV